MLLARQRIKSLELLVTYIIIIIDAPSALRVMVVLKTKSKEVIRNGRQSTLNIKFKNIKEKNGKIEDKTKTLVSMR